MKRTVKITALALLVATTAIFATSCGGNANKKQSADTATETATETKAEAAKGNDYADAEAFSVKYVVDGDTYIVTRSMDNDLRRLDHIAANGTHNIYITRYENSELSGVRYEGNQWTNSVNAGTEIQAFKLWESRHLYYKDAGFTKSGNAAVAGANCVLWTGTQQEMSIRYADLPMGKPAEIAVWNNKVTMRLKSDGKVIMEAKAFTANVPETAFTQTVETTWIK